jgi:hypothetical protein
MMMTYRHFERHFHLTWEEPSTCTCAEGKRRIASERARRFSINVFSIELVVDG